MKLGFKKKLKAFWRYVNYDDSIGAFLLYFIFAFLIIKFIFFPVVGFFMHTDYPGVAIVSGSMEHKISNSRVCNNIIMDSPDRTLTMDDWWFYCGSYYIINYNISKEEFSTLPYSSGLNTGDVMIIYGKKPEDVKVGDIIVFSSTHQDFAGTNGQIIHRVVKTWEEDGKRYYQTKGDHNPVSGNGESKISEDQLVGVAVLKIPYVGYVKIFINNIFLFTLGLFR